MVVVAVGVGCAGVEPCVPGGCAEGTVCGLDGTCGPLEGAKAARFASAERLLSLGSVIRHADGSDTGSVPDDQLPICGPHGAVAYLDLGPLGGDGDIDRAVLALSPHPSWTGATAPWRVAVTTSPPVAEVRERHRRPPYRSPVRVVRVPVGVGRTLYLDVTPLARAARAEGRERVSLAVLCPDRRAELLRFASGRAVDEALRPRIELLTR